MKSKRNKIIMAAAVFAMALIIGIGGNQNAIAQSKKNISEEAAKNIALKDAKLKGKKVSYVKAKKEKEDGRWIYNIEFYYGNKEYDYEIDALTGKILEKDLDIESFELPSKKDKNLISKEKAKDLAISHAKIKNTDVESFKIKNDIENGKPVYEIKLYTKNYEYDFELDAKTGEVLSFEKDALDENDD